MAAALPYWTSDGLTDPNSGASDADLTDHSAAADPHTGYVLESLFDANSSIAADSDNTPTVRAADASTIYARLASGSIKFATVAEIKTLLAYVMSDLTDNVAWTEVLGGVGFQNSWVNYGGGASTAGYRKVGKTVYLKGLVKTGNNATTIFTLPSGYRPTNTVSFASVGHSVTDVQGLQIFQVTSAGAVASNGLGGAGMHLQTLDGIFFTTDQ